jgi:hypothetical protein
LSYGLTPGETRYSPLKQIDATNVRRLGLAWSYEVEPGGGNQEATAVCDVRNRRGGPRDTAPGRPVRVRLCVVHVMVRAGGATTAAARARYLVISLVVQPARLKAPTFPH